MAYWYTRTSRKRSKYDSATGFSNMHVGMSVHADYLRRAAHWICSKWDKHNYSWTKSYDQARTELQWSTLSQRHAIILTCCQTYKILNSLDCISFEKYFRLIIPQTQGITTSHFFVQSRINCYRHSYTSLMPLVAQ